ncbi:MAG: adenylyltransferase/cytidyltransferase family protein, partial [Synergistaceae bacterium]|nr:adenylyltransferase/cytidyltransferase family protein [Synergistaceae bacterium]
MKTGIMGGTFDPIHYGHLLAAEEARRNLGIERLIFVPTGDPPHKRDHHITSS